MRKRSKDFCFAINVPRNQIEKLLHELDSNSDELYNQWKKPKKESDGSIKVTNGVIQTREINAPVINLKTIQSRILTKCLYSIKLPPYFYGGVKKKDGVLNARFHQGNKYFFQTDLKNFYPSISYKMVENVLRKKGFYPEVAKIITRLSTKDGVVPQGCPTSSFLAALVVENLIGDVIQKYIVKGYKISVFVDDITISSPIDFKDETPRIIEEFRSRGLLINFEKTSYCTKNPKVTGILVKNNGIAPLPKTFEGAKDPNKSENSRIGHQRRIDYVKKKSKGNSKKTKIKHI